MIRRHTRCLRRAARWLPALCLLSQPALGGPPPPSDGTGLETAGGSRVIRVVIAPLHEDALTLGLTPERLKSSVEERLKSHGFRIVEQDAEADWHHLFVRVTCVKEAHDIDLMLNRWVEYRAGKTRYQVLACTWSKGSTGIRHDAEAIVQAVLGLVEQFAAAYLQANPQAPPPPPS